jgi:hypothetical protein
MAAMSRSTQIREQWSKLGEEWQQKAEKEDQVDLNEAPPNLASTLVPEVLPAQQNLDEVSLHLPTLMPTSEVEQQKLETVRNLTPTLIPDAVQLQDLDVSLYVATGMPISEIEQERLEAVANLAPTLIPDAVQLQEKPKPAPRPPLFDGSSAIWGEIASPIDLES